MIIGISGRIGSGKDECGKIVQYLFYLNSDIHKDNKLSYEAFVKTDRVNNLLISNIVPEIKKFADSLKYIVCILTGCTREDLEDSDFKNSILPDEWQYVTIENKRVSIETYNKYIEGTTYIPKKGDICIYTYRDLLTTVGTNLLRNQLHENVWVNALMSKYIKAESLDGTYPSKHIVFSNPNWIITDTRFPNEAKVITDKGGINIRLTRNSNNPANHESETALDNYKFDYIINNDNGDIPELIENIKVILIKEGII